MSIDKFQLNYGDWVKCNDKIMFVYDMKEEDPNLVGLTQKDSKKYQDEYGFTFYEAEYHPASEIDILPPCEIDEDTLLSFFRLETTPWEMSEKGCYPISKISPFILADDDLKAISKNIHDVDAMSLDAWIYQFLNFKPFNSNKDESIGLTLQLTLTILQQNMAIFDVEEDDRYKLTEIIDVYLNNKGKSFKDINVSSFIKKQIIVGMEAQTEEEITEDEKEGYALFLEELYLEGDIDSIRHMAYAAYGGSQLVERNWKKAEEALLKLFDMGKEEVAYSLANIYFKHGDLGEPDYAKAFSYYKVAADFGIVDAKLKLCHMYLKGLGVKRDSGQAFSLLKELYDQQLRIYQHGQYDCNYPEVAMHMGRYCEKGIGCTKDFEEAKRYFEMAKESLAKRKLQHPHKRDRGLDKTIDDSIKRINDKIAASEDFETLNSEFKIS